MFEDIVRKLINKRSSEFEEIKDIVSDLLNTTIIQKHYIRFGEISFRNYGDCYYFTFFINTPHPCTFRFLIPLSDELFRIEFELSGKKIDPQTNYRNLLTLLRKYKFKLYNMLSEEAERLCKHFDKFGNWDVIPEFVKMKDKSFIIKKVKTFRHPDTPV